ncbi:hypothetical protein BV22DRAFT_1104545 [Leucogyrophana mollusca]|uniref:Uncharacterized protein n=1 Tax=Leucogyrophana mollusca TaxID=85980 RepID=A0ACB8BMK1_9AGAM|nr:hypothetical protein BV22DRAFT_1104545 [Leucogyrophana mollusca]
MFKRVERKRKKREEEEELGLDDEVKDIIGLNDTDSDESESDESDADSDTEDGPEEEGAGGRSGEAGVDVLDSEESDEELNEAEGKPPISIQEALKDPVYIVSLDPDVKACLICKGKLIKSTQMAVVHKGSTAHKRRLDRFKKLALRSKPDDDAWDLVRSSQPVTDPQQREHLAEEGLSKRAQKRRSKLGAIKEKRQLHKKLKAKAMAKKEAAKARTIDKSPSPNTQDPPKKRQKLTSQIDVERTTKAPAKPSISMKSSTNRPKARTAAAKSRNGSGPKKASKSKAA